MESCENEFVQYLSEHTECPSDQLNILKKLLKRQMIKQNDYFICVNEKPQKFAYINKDVFKVYSTREDGKMVTLAFRTEGDIIAPYTPVKFDMKVWYYIEALTDCYIQYISVQDYKKLVKGHVCWEAFEKKCVLEFLKEKEERERSLLMDSAKTRYNNFLMNYQELVDRLQQKDIASYIGITPVSLSRLKAQKNH